MGEGTFFLEEFAGLQVLRLLAFKRAGLAVVSVV